MRGAIFTSGLTREIFTAGNDLAELYAPKTSLERYTEFWTVATTFLARLLRSPLVTVSLVQHAAANTHAAPCFIDAVFPPDVLRPPLLLRMHV